MEQTSHDGVGGSPPWEYSLDQDRLAFPTILLVEDDRDIREMITTLLDMSGFNVVACETAEAGLNALREQDFDLILTDYALPRQSGLWLLQEAQSEGLLEDRPALIVTAHPQVAGGDSYEVIQKPLDLDELVDRIRRRLEAAGTSGRQRRAAKSGSGDGMNGGGFDCPGPIELILYVSSPSPGSKVAVREMEKLLERFSSSRVKLTLCNLSERPIGALDATAASPATVTRPNPGPRTFILGHITNPELLLELLADCDVDLN
jgi:CheY-like chemotaxis protein